MISFTIQGKKVRVFPAAGSGRPIVYLHTFAQEGDRVFRALQHDKAPDFTLAAVSNLDWDHDMTPWDCPPLSKHDSPCTGGADDYLSILTGQIVPDVEKQLSGEPAWRGIAGYSLAGLFAVYALYRTDLFSRAASMSGSLWFPDFYEYICSHDMKRRPDHLYFSLGDKECKVKNPYLRTVQENTEKIHAFYAGQGIDTLFRLNPGNHYVNAAERTASGIGWILKAGEDLSSR